VAAFDVDGTITTRDCVTPFLLRAAGPRLVLTLLGHPLAVAAAVVHRDRDRLKGVACSALRGIDGAAVDELGASFAREIASRWLREDVVARLRRHRQLGHRVILASASLDPYVVPLGRLLDVDDVVCTVLERGPDGRLTGRLAGANCRAAEKARRVAAWLDAQGLAGAELWAYGDSPGDRELLASADRAVWVDATRLEGEPR
jgi:phosphatidylglycerophosphatase C